MAVVSVSDDLDEVHNRLKQELAAHAATARELARLRSELESCVATMHRYETALRGSNVTVFTQDRDLRYTSISNPMFGRDTREIVGSTDDDILPAESRPAVVAMKLTALQTGTPQDGEVRINDGSTNRWFDLHIEPLRDADDAIIGLTCAAVDVTERKEGEAHLRLLMRELTHRSEESPRRDPGDGAPDRPACTIDR